MKQRSNRFNMYVELGNGIFSILVFYFLAPYSIPILIYGIYHTFNNLSLLDTITGFCVLIPFYLMLISFKDFFHYYDKWILEIEEE